MVAFRRRFLRGVLGWAGAALLVNIVSVPCLGQQGVGGGARAYEGNKVVRVRIRGEEDLRLMQTVSPDMWSESAGVGGAGVDFRVPGDALEKMRSAGLTFTVLIDDVQALVDAEAARLAHAHDPANGPNWFADYKTLPQIEEYLVTLQGAAPDRVSLVDLGVSLEQRHTRGMAVVGTGGTRQRPAVFLNSCQHAREWISPMTNMYVADALTRQYGVDPRITRVLDRVRFYILPVSNPDGYTYTWANSNNRLWRKNRRPNPGGSFGVDLNRNWGFHWGEIGASPDPADDQYRGAAAWSEPEVVNMRDFILGHADIQAHIDLHSYAQYVLYPWSYTPNPSPQNAVFVSLAASMASAIRGINNVVYQPGQWYSRLYPSSGTMIDYAYGDRAITSFTIELRDTGAFGFVLPPAQIVPTGREILPAVLTLAETLYRPADWNGDRFVNSQDLFDFVADFFSNNADFNGVGGTTSQDFFDFLGAFLGP